MSFPAVSQRAIGELYVWGRNALVDDQAGRLKDDFCVRWDGLLKVDKPGTYSITIKVDDGGRFWLGDRQMCKNAWKLQGATRYTEKIELAAGWHPIRMEWYERGGLTAVHLYWALEGGFGEEVIPAKALYHSPGENARSVPGNAK